MDDARSLLARLETWLGALSSTRIAVSGGVDSMTLAMKTLGFRAILDFVIALMLSIIRLKLLFP